MTIVVGGHNLGLLDGSQSLLGRDDRTQEGSTASGVETYANVSNGNLIYQERDAFLPSRGEDFSLVRSYNSRGVIGGSSDGWRLSTAIQLSSHQDKPAGQSASVTNYSVFYGDGSEAHFEFDSSRGRYVSTDGAGAFETLQVLAQIRADGTKYIVTRANQTQYNFDKDFVLLSSVDTNGVRMDFQYQGGKLTQVRDDTGHTLTYGYDGLGKLTSIADETGVTLVTYGYTQGLLTTVTDRYGHVTTYGYDNNGLLISVDLPRSQTVGGQVQTFDQRQIRFTYERVNWDDKPHFVTDFDRGYAWVVRQVQDAEGGVTTFDYTFQFSTTNVTPDDRDARFVVTGGRYLTGATTRVVDSLGNARAASNAAEYVAWRQANGFYATYDAAAVAASPALKAQYDAIRNAQSMVYVADADGYITQVTDQQGFRTTYTYDLKDNLTSITDRNGHGAANSDSAYFRSLRKELGFVDAAGNGKLAATLTSAERTAILNRFTTRYTYDTRGNLLTKTDNAGNVTSFTYTTFDKVASETSAVGNALATLDDAQSRQKRLELGFPGPLASVSTAQRNALRTLYTTTYTYDARQNLITRSDAGGDVTRFEYDIYGNRTRRIVVLDPADPNNPAKQQITTYSYDVWGQLSDEVDAEGALVHRDYDHFGNVTRMVDGRGGVTTYTYDGDNRLLSETDPEGHVTSYAYDAAGNRISVTNANGNTVLSVYNRNNLLVSVIDPSTIAGQSRTTTFVYDITGNRTQSTDAEGRRVLYTFDARRKLVVEQALNVLGPTGTSVSYSRTFAYDGEGNIVTTTDRNGNVTQTLYTTTGLVQRTTDAVGNVTEFVYDRNLATLQIIVGAQLAPALRRVLTFRRDEENQIVSETDALGGVTAYSYDAPGNVASVTDANGNRTDYQYDRNNRLVRETRPAVVDPATGLSRRYTVVRQYDANGNEIATTDEDGRTTTYAFDKDNRLVLVTAGNGIQTAYEWDAVDNRTKIAIGVQARIDADRHVVIDSDQQAAVTTFVYDEFNQILSSTDGVGNALAASDLTLYADMRESLGYARTVAALTVADKANLRARHTERYEHDRVGNRTRVTDALGRVAQVQYDALDRVISRTDAAGTTSARTTSMRYDGNGNVVTLTDALGRVSRYTFDAVDRQLTETDATGMVTRSEYDNVGNLTSETEASGTPQARTTRYVYDLNDRLTSETDPMGFVRSYRYDAVGNRLEVTDARGSRTQYVYDAMNRNIRVIDPLGFQTRFEYDGAGNRITIVDANGGIERLQYDGASRYVQTTDPEGRVTRFQYDVLDNVITQTTAFGRPEAQVTRFEYDAESNLRRTVDAAGNVSTQDFDTVYNLVRSTDGNGNVTTAVFDALDRQIRVTDPLGGVTTYAYDAEDNVLTETDALGRVRTFVYDAVDRVIRQTDALGVQTNFAYDLVGNQVAITRAAGTPDARTSTFTYDLNDRLVTETDAMGQVTAYAYDGNGNAVRTTDALGRVTSYDYDANNRVVRITDPLGHQTRYVYDGKGNRVQVIDARGFAETTWYNLDDEVVLRVNAEGAALSRAYDGNGNVVSETLFMTPVAGTPNPAVRPVPVTSLDDRTSTFGYDALNRIVRETNPLGGVVLYSYDAVGNRLTETDENGNATAFEYDANDRLVRRTDPLGGQRTYTYDAVGNLLSEVDENGHATTFAYDAENRLVRETDPLGGAKIYTYDAVANRTSATDENGHVTRYTYDLADRLVAEIDPLGGIIAYGLDAVGNRITVTDERGGVVRFTFDGMNRQLTQTDALGGISSTAYDAVGNVVSSTDENGRVTTFTYDKINRRLAETDPLGGVTIFTWDAADNQTSETDPNGHTTVFAYDRNDRQIRVTDPLGGVTTFAYDAAGNRVTETDPNGNATQTAYDANNRIVRVTDPLGHSRVFVLDAVGNRISEADENGNVTTFSYDANDRLVGQTNAIGGIRTFAYDAAGNQVSETDELGRTTGSAYDANNRLVSRTDANGEIQTFTYDASGNRLTATDEEARTTSFAYDANDRLVRQTDALGGVQTWGYDAVGNRTSYTDEEGRTSLYAFDANDRQVSETDPLGGVRLVAYDAVGNQISVTDENGHVTTYQYDDNDRLTGQTDALGGVRVFAFDAAGNQLSETDENGNVVQFTYDAANRRVSQTDALGGVRQFVLDAVGNEVGVVDENGNEVAFTYDALDRLIARTDALGGTTSYQYDAVGNLVLEKDELLRETVRVYDALDRQIRVEDALGGISLASFDRVGNQLSATDAEGRVTLYEYDANDRLVSETDPLGGVRSFVYDLVGNRTSETDQNGNTTTFSYDANDRMVEQTNALGIARTFAYDAAGNKIAETDENGNTTTFSYDADNRLIEATDALGGVRSYGYDAVGNQVSETDENGNATTKTYDANDRETGRTDALGNSQSFTYDAVGNRLTETDENDSTTTYAYDALDRLTTRTDAVGGVRSFTYDATGNRLTETDERGNTTTSSYDALNRRVLDVNPLGASVAYEFDAVGNLTSQTDENGHTTTFVYDDNNRLIEETDPLGGNKAYTYDAVGNQTSVTDENGHTTTTAYDELNREKTITDPLGGERSFGYDGVGNVIAETDENGFTYTRTYDANDRVLSETDPAGGETLFFYDAAGNNIQIENALGHRVTNYFDANDRLVMTVDADGVVFETAYDAAGNAVSATVRGRKVAVPVAPETKPVIVADSRDQTLLFRHDSLNRLVETTDAEGGVSTREYDVVGNLISLTDNNGNVTTYEYDANDRLVVETNALGQTKEYGYDAKGNRVSESDTGGNVTLFAYDANDREISKTDPLGGESTTSYDAVGNALVETDATGRTTTRTYDELNRLKSEADGAGGTREFEYDAVGNLLKETDEAGVVTTFTYDSRRNLLTETDGETNTVTHEYDALSNEILVADESGGEITRSYDRRQQVTSETDALGGTTQYGYDTAGNRVVVTSPNGNDEFYYRDRNNRVVLMVDALGFATSTDYDANGNILSVTIHAVPLALPLDPDVRPTVVTDAGDRTTSYTWDALNRKTSETDPRGVTTEYEYDDAGNQVLRRQNMTVPSGAAGPVALAAASAATTAQVSVVRDYYDANSRRIASLSSEGILTTYEYDAAGRERVRTEYLGKYAAPEDGTPPEPLAADVGRTTTTTYDAAGRKATETSPTGLVTTIEYDAAGRERSRTVGSGTSARQTLTTYDRAGRIATVTDAMGTVTKYVLDRAGKVKEKHEAFGRPEVRVTTYDYYRNGRLKSETDAENVRTEYKYNADGQLTERKTAVGIVGEERTETFEYDDAGFLKAQVNGEGERVEFEYDSAGNRSVITVAPGKAAERTLRFDYDAANRLEYETDGAGVQTRHEYDGAGNRIKTTQAYNKPGFERVTLFGYDTDNRLISVTDPEGGVTLYGYDAVGNRNRIEDPNGSVTINTFDAMGRLETSTSGVGGPGGGILVVNTYDDFGNLTSTTRSFADGTDASVTTYEYDALDRQTVVTDGEGFSTEFDYDRFGNQKEVRRGTYRLQPGDDGYDATKAARVHVQTTSYDYDKMNRLVLTEDGEGNQVASTYDARGNRLTQTTAVGTLQEATVTFEYDLADRVTKKTTATGGRTVLEYDEAGNQTAIKTLQSVLSDGTEVVATVTFTYDGNGRAITETDALGYVTGHEIDFYGNETGVVYAQGTDDERAARSEFDGNGRKVADIDALGNRSEYTLDGAGNRILESDPLGRVTHYYYDENNQLVGVLDPEGYLTRYTRDSGGNITATSVYMQQYTPTPDDRVAPTPLTTDTPRVVSSSFDKADNLVSQTEADGVTKLFERDSAGLLTKQTLRATTAADRVARTRDPDDRISTFSYDDAGRLKEYLGPDGTKETYKYDAANNRIEEKIESTRLLPGGRTDPVRVTTFSYDLDNRQTGQSFANGLVTLEQTLSYDLAGNVVSKTDANGNVTLSAYDILNRLIEVTDAEGGIVTYGYDRVGNQTSIEDARGNTTNITFDKANRATKVEGPAVSVFALAGTVPSMSTTSSATWRPTTTTTYDAVGNVVQVTDANGNKVTAYFDGNNNKVAEVNGDFALRTFTYDATGAVTSVSQYMSRLDASDPLTHDPTVLPVAPLDSEVRTVTTTFDAAGRAIRTTYPQITVTTLSGTTGNNPTATTALVTPEELSFYDAFGDAVESVARDGSRSYAYYDEVGRQIANVDGAGYLTETVFDDQGRVVRQTKYKTPVAGTVSAAAKPTGAAADAVTVDRTYDAAGRLVAELSAAAKTGQVGGTDVFSNIKTTYVYDGNGNLLSRTVAAETTDAATERYYYDGLDRQVAVVTAGRTLNVFEYDENGNKTSQTRYLTPLATSVVLDGASVSSLLSAVVKSTTGDQTTTFEYDAGNRLLKQTDVIRAEGETTNLVGNDISTSTEYDPMGNVTRRTDPDGNVSTMGYNAVGKITQTYTPNGAASFVEYDTGGLKLRAWTGGLPGGSAQQATNVAASVSDALNISWSQPGTGSSSWVVWSATPKTIADGKVPADVYTNKTGETGSGNVSASIPLASVPSGGTVYFRVVSQDAAGNIAWTDEFDVTVPTIYNSLVVRESGADLQVEVQFAGTVSTPVLKYGARNSSLPNTLGFDSLGGGRFRATLVAPPNPQSLAFQVQWTAGGQNLAGAVIPFEATEAHVAVGTQIGIDVPQVNGADVGGSQIVVVNGLQDLEADTVRVNDRLNFDPEIGTGPGTHVYSVFWGDRVSQPHTVAVRNEDRQFTTVKSDGATFNNAEPPVQTARTVVLEWNHDYRTVVETTLSAAERATVVGGLKIATKAANTSDQFTGSTTATLASGVYSATLALNPGTYDLQVFYDDASGNRVIVQWRRIVVPAATLPADASITDTSGPFDFAGQSITSGGQTDDTFPFALSRTVTGTSPAPYTGQSLRVTATERAGTITRAGNGTLSVDPGLYAGPKFNSNAAVSLAVGNASSSSGAGSLSSDGLSAQTYFTEIVYNALGDRIATNEDTGLWRTLGVDAAGRAVVERVFGTQQDEIDFGDGIAGHDPIDSFKQYDARGRVIKSFGALGPVAGLGSSQRPVTTTTYDYEDRVLTVRDPGTATARTYQYDGVGNVIRETDALSHAKRWTYDSRGNVTMETDALSRSIVRTYDTADNMLTETDATGVGVTFTYDAFGRRLTQKDGLNNVISLAYDQHDRLVTLTNAENEVTSYFYDKRDNQIWMKDGNGHWFGTGYDGMGRAVASYRFVGGSPANLAEANGALSVGGTLTDKLVKTLTVYDVFGNKSAEVDANGRRRVFTYGAFGRLLTTSQEDVTFTGTGAAGLAYTSTAEYDRFGRVIRQSSDRNQSGTTRQNIERSYDSAGRLAKVDDKTTKIRTEYTYDIAGRRVSEIITNYAPETAVVLRSVSQTYYDDGDLKRWTDSITGKNLNYTYDNVGNITKVASDDTAVLDQTYTYDAANRIATFNQTGTANTFTYDVAGNRKTWNDGTTTFTYAYDGAGRVTTVTNSANAGHADWTYDEIGNVTKYQEFSDATTVTKTSQNTYREDNQIVVTVADAITTTTTYDLTGRTLSQTVKDATDSASEKNYTYTFAYNKDGTQKSVTATGSSSASGSSSSTYNVNGELVRIDLGQGDGKDSPEYKTFVYNNEGQIISRFQDDGKNDTTNKTTQFLYANGNPIGETDDTGALVLNDGNYDLVKIIGADFPESSVTGYEVQNGDTLQSIAAQIYGNPSLWFVIADANGLTGSETLSEGTRLQVPNTNENGRLTADTHALYSESEIVGSKLPNISVPPPPDDKCKVIAAIILVVVVAIVAVVITVVTVGIAAPAAAAALGLSATSAAGIIVGVAVGAAIGAAVAFVASVVTQGILVGFGLQKEFDWKQVAADTVAGAFGGATAGLGKLIEAGLLAGKLARIAVAVASAVLEASGEAARQAIANDGRIDAPWAIALAGVGGAFGALTTRATRITRTIDKTGKTILKVAKKAPAGTVIKGVKGKAVTVFDSAGKKFVLSDENFKLVKTATGRLRVVQRVGSSLSKTEKVKRAFLKTFGVGRTVSRAADGTKKVNVLVLRKVSGKGAKAIFEQRMVTKTVTRNVLTKGKSLVVDGSTKLRLVNGQITKVRRVSDQYTRLQRISRFFSRTFNVGSFATKTAKGSKLGSQGLKTIKGPKYVLNTATGLLEEQRGVTQQVTRSRLLDGKKVILSDRIKLRLIDGQVQKVQRVSDQYTKFQRLQRLLKVGDFKVGATLSKATDGTKQIRAGMKLVPAGGIALQGALREADDAVTVTRKAIKAGNSIKLDKQIKLLKVGDKLTKVRRISDQYTRTERVARRLGRAFNVGKYADVRTVEKLGTGLKKVATYQLRKSKTLTGVLEETQVVRKVTRQALRDGKSLKKTASIKLRLVDGKITKIRRISDQYTRLERVQRKFGRLFGVGKFAETTTLGKFSATKSIRRYSLQEITQGPLKGKKVFEEVRQAAVVGRLSSTGQSRRALAAAALTNFKAAAGVAGKKAGNGISNLLNTALDFSPADLFGKAGNKGTNGRVLLGWVGSIGIPVGGNIALGTTYPYEDHPPGPMGFLIKMGVAAGKGLKAYAMEGNGTAENRGTPTTSPDFGTAMLPALNIILKGEGAQALRRVGYKPLREPIETGVRAIEDNVNYSVRDSMELFDVAHGRQHRWIPFDWTKTAGEATTQIFSPFSLDRAAPFAANLAANQLVTGQVAQYDRESVQGFAAGSVGRVTNYTMPLALLDNQAPPLPQVG